MNFEPLIEISQTGLRLNGLEFFHKASCTNARRVRENRKRLPHQVVGVPSLTSFKSRLEALRPNEPGAILPIYNRADSPNGI